MLKLKLQYFGHLMRRADSFEKTLMLGKTEGRRRRGRQRMRWLVGITDTMDMSLGEPGAGNRQGGLACCGWWGRKRGHDWATELNWTEVYSMPTFWRDFIISRCWFCQKLSLYLLRWLYGFYLSVYWSEKAMAPHSSTLAWKIPRTEEPGGLQSKGLRRVGHDWATSFHFSLSCIGEGNGSPLQCSCLENPRDGGAWWASVYGVTKSQTWLKWLIWCIILIDLWMLKNPCIPGINSTWSWCMIL